MIIDDYDKAQGHWILARMGKRVLRPGGKDLTQKLIENLNVGSNDTVVEFAPGIGYTAQLILKLNPLSYSGIDLNPQVVDDLRRKFINSKAEFLLSNAAETGLAGASIDKVFGEAMLTMHADYRKEEIVREAFRILKKGGFYAIHELGLFPGSISAEKKSEIYQDLARTIKVNARPLIETEWIALLEKGGFTIQKIERNSMKLLQPTRIISDEGFFRALKIGFNILSHPAAKRRVRAMRGVFLKHKEHINALMILARKN